MFDPPSQPAAGWYPDPHVPGHERWWNGRDWEERWNPPLPSLDVHGLPDIGSWLGRAFRRAWGRFPSAVIVAVVTNAIPAAILFLAARSLVDDVVITTDGDVLGWSGDRLPGAIAAACVAFALFVVGTLAMQALMLRTVDADTAGTGRTAGGHGRHAAGALRDAVRCLPRAVGWFLLLALGGLLIVIPMVVLAAISPLFIVLFVLAAIPSAVWLGIRWAFGVVAVVDGPGNPFRRSSEVVRGRWWAVFGRLLLLAVIMWAISFGINAVTSSIVDGGAFGEVTFEVDQQGNLTDDLVLADLFPTGPWAITLGVVGGLLVNVASTVGLAGAAELFRTRHRADGRRP